MCTAGPGSTGDDDIIILGVANFDSEALALTRMEHGANPWRPTNFRGRFGRLKNSGKAGGA